MWGINVVTDSEGWDAAVAEAAEQARAAVATLEEVAQVQAAEAILVALRPEVDVGTPVLVVSMSGQRSGDSGELRLVVSYAPAPVES